MSNWLKKLRRFYRRNRGLTLAAVAVVVIIIGVFYFQKFNRYVPPEFLSAREQAAGTAEEIVQLSSESRNNIQAMEEKNASHQYKEGLALIETERARNDQMRQKAATFSGQLQIMALNLTGIKPKEGTLAGAQAISTAVEMTKHLDAYINYSYELLAAFEDRFQGDNSQATEKEIEYVIGKMNGEVDQINQLNSQYKDQMKQFNRLTG